MMWAYIRASQKTRSSVEASRFNGSSSQGADAEGSIRAPKAHQLLTQESEEVMTEREQERERQADIAVQRSREQQEAQDRQREKLGEKGGQQSDTGEKRKEQAKKQEEQARETLDKLEDAAQSSATPTYKPSAERSKESGNPHPIKPEDRVPTIGLAYTASADSAAGAIGAARAQLEGQLEADKRIQSDPRWERDQKVFEMGQKGQLGLVPPSEAEVAAQAVRGGMPSAVAEKLPTTPEEQAADDMERLEKGEKRAEVISPAANSGDKEVREKADKQNAERQKEAQKQKPPEPPKGSTIK